LEAELNLSWLRWPTGNSIHTSEDADAAALQWRCWMQGPLAWHRCCWRVRQFSCNTNVHGNIPGPGVVVMTASLTFDGMLHGHLMHNASMQAADEINALYCGARQSRIY